MLIFKTDWIGCELGRLEVRVRVGARAHSRPSFSSMSKNFAN